MADPEYPQPLETARLILADQVGAMPDFLFNAITDAMEAMDHQTHELKAILELIIVDLEHILMEEPIHQPTRRRIERALHMARRGIIGDVRDRGREPW